MSINIKTTEGANMIEINDTFKATNKAGIIYKTIKVITLDDLIKDGLGAYAWDLKERGFVAILHGVRAIKGKQKNLFYLHKNDDVIHVY